MANAANIAQQMMNYGNLDPTRNDKKKDTNAWEKQMAMLAMAQKMNPRFMLGALLGQLLKQGFDSWKSNYDKRGELKAKKNEGKEWNNPNAQMMYEGAPTPQGGMLNIAPNGQPQDIQSGLLNAAANIQAQNNSAQDNLPTQWQQALQSGEQLQQLGGSNYEELLRRMGLLN